MFRRTFTFAGLLLLLLILSQSAQAQQPIPTSYLFVEIADASGEVVEGATIRVSNADGKEMVNGETDKNGIVNTRFRLYGNAYHYDLQITKPGYLPYHSVLFRNNPYDSHTARLTEEMPTVAPGIGPSINQRSLPIKIILQRPPATPTDLRVAELEEKKHQVVLAAKRGDAAVLRKMLQLGADPNWADSKGVPAIVWATFAGHPETIKLLLDAGANVRKKTSVAHEALLIYLAEGMRRVTGQAEIVDKLIAAGADVNASTSYQGTVLTRAIGQINQLSLESIKGLIKEGADVKAVDPLTGETPLLMASSWFRDSSLPLFKALLANGASIFEVDRRGETPLMRASLGASVEMIQILLKAGAAINAKDNQGQTPLMYAVKHYSTPDRDVQQTVRLLLEAGADVNSKDNDGQTPLAVARKRGHAEIVKLLEEAQPRP
jgi:ankyrin repeat protein